MSTELKNKNMPNLRADSFITILPWMRNKFDLKGNELLIYAVIHGFSLSDGGWFTGSQQYLADWCGCDRRTVQRGIDKLE
jgi:hypothetical protein